MMRQQIVRYLNIGCGLAVVSTDIPYCKIHKYVKTANDNISFINEIRKALKITAEERYEMIKFALNNKWSNSVNNLALELDD